MDYTPSQTRRFVKPIDYDPAIRADYNFFLTVTHLGHEKSIVKGIEIKLRGSVRKSKDPKDIPIKRRSGDSFI
jgi:hypothetical protein